MSKSSIPLFRVCTKCQQEFPNSGEFFYGSKRGKNGLSPHCKQCHLTISKRAYQKKWEERGLKTKIRDNNIKAEVMTHYGNGKCACVRCGYDTLAALTLDHINDDGFKEVKSGKQLYRYLRSNNYPPGFQTLCMNCQYIKREANGNGSRVRPRPNRDRG